MKKILQYIARVMVLLCALSGTTLFANSKAGFDIGGAPTSHILINDHARLKKGWLEIQPDTPNFRVRPAQADTYTIYADYFPLVPHELPDSYVTNTHFFDGKTSGFYEVEVGLKDSQ